MFSLYEVAPLPEPHAPANRAPIPSTISPLFTAALEGNGAPHTLQIIKLEYNCKNVTRAHTGFSTLMGTHARHTLVRNSSMA